MMKNTQIMFLSIFLFIFLNSANGSELLVKNVTLEICSEKICANIFEFSVHFNSCNKEANSNSTVQIYFKVQLENRNFDSFGFLAYNGSVYAKDSSIVDNRRTKM
jgi:hypothetical protein